MECINTNTLVSVTKKEEPLFSGNRTTRRRKERGESVNQEKSGSLKKEEGKEKRGGGIRKERK